MNPIGVDSVLHEAVIQKLQDLTSNNRLQADRPMSITTGQNMHLYRSRTDRQSFLPAYFKPTPYSIIVGRGKEAKINPGNVWLNDLASTYLDQYSQAKEDKQIKTRIVSQIITIVGNNGGAFIKRTSKNGPWYEVDNSVAREKIGYVFRDLLSDEYRSSSKAKHARRSQKQLNSLNQSSGKSKVEKKKEAKRMRTKNSPPKPTGLTTRNSLETFHKSTFEIPIDLFTGFPQDLVSKTEASDLQQADAFDVSSSFLLTPKTKDSAVFTCEGINSQFNQLLTASNAMPFDGIMSNCFQSSSQNMPPASSRMNAVEESRIYQHLFDEDADLNQSDYDQLLKIPLLPLDGC